MLFLLISTFQIESYYKKDKEVFLKRVFESTKYLEEVTGLTELHKLSECLEVCIKQLCLY